MMTTLNLTLSRGLVWIGVIGAAGIQHPEALQEGTTATRPASSEADGAFSISHAEGDHIDVRFQDRTLLRLMIANDLASEERAHETYKVFAHVLDPLDADNARFLTKGAGGKFTHHRGIFIGWNKAVVQGVGEVDTWHMNGVRQCFDGVLTQEVQADSATLAISVDWVKGDQPLLREVRTFVVHKPRRAGDLLIDTSSVLTATVGETTLKGDPEHAGIQFRASQAVAENQSATYVFPEGMRADPTDGTVDMPWAGMEFQIEGRAYHVQHMSHPNLPEGNVYSAYRDYGRFGSYFQATLAEGESATFRARFYVSPGALPANARGKMEERYTSYRDSAE